MFGPEYPYLAGHVGVQKNHPLYQVNLEDIKDISVHGGIVKAGSHIPVFGETPELWWLSFECAFSLEPFSENKDEGFVEAQCIYLANQLHEKTSTSSSNVILMANHSGSLH